MINSDQIIHLRIDEKTKHTITILVSLIFILFTGLSVYYVVVEPDPSEDFRLAVIALLPTAAMILVVWLFILKVKGTLSERDLMEQTAWMLGIEIPQAISRLNFSFTRTHNSHFNEVDWFATDMSKTINLYDDEYIYQAKELLSIKSNLMIGVPSCRYLFSGKSIAENSLAAQLEMYLQINIKRIEVIYKIPCNCNDNCSCDILFETTKLGTEGAGYAVKIVTCDSNCQMQARMQMESDLLVNSRERLFIINDIAVMTGHILCELSKIPYTKN